MSDETDISPNAKEIKARAADWLQRRNFWNWGEEDERALAAWLEESLSHRVAYWRLRSAWERSEKLTALRGPAFGRTEQAPPVRRLWPTLRMAAAGIALIAAVGVGATYIYSAPRGQSFATPIGGREVLTLADGSQVELNTDTSLRTDIGANHRTVWLEKGEAFFQVVHDEKRPFVVYAGDHRVTDLGTKFSVRKQPDRLEVALVEGRAQFDSNAGNGKPTVLVPGDILVATAKSTSLTRKPEHELERELSWRQGNIVFSHTTLADAAAQFNRYNTEKITIADPAVAKLTIDGTFPINGVHAFARVTNVVFKLRVEKRDGETILSR
jgi:transmembrane sensor